MGDEETKITPETISDKLLYDVLYEYARKSGLDDPKAAEWALSMQWSVQGAISHAGGDVDLVPEG